MKNWGLAMGFGKGLENAGQALGPGRFAMEQEQNEAKRRQQLLDDQLKSEAVRRATMEDSMLTNAAQRDNLGVDTQYRRGQVAYQPTEQAQTTAKAGAELGMIGAQTNEANLGTDVHRAVLGEMPDRLVMDQSRNAAQVAASYAQAAAAKAMADDRGGFQDAVRYAQAAGDKAAADVGAAYKATNPAWNMDPKAHAGLVAAENEARAAAMKQNLTMFIWLQEQDGKIRPEVAAVMRSKINEIIQASTGPAKTDPIADYIKSLGVPQGTPQTQTPLQPGTTVDLGGKPLGQVPATLPTGPIKRNPQAQLNGPLGLFGTAEQLIEDYNRTPISYTSSNGKPYTGKG